MSADLLTMIERAQRANYESRNIPNRKNTYIRWDKNIKTKVNQLRKAAVAIIERRVHWVRADKKRERTENRLALPRTVFQRRRWSIMPSLSVSLYSPIPLRGRKRYCSAITLLIYTFIFDNVSRESTPELGCRMITLHMNLRSW